jgi:hypothetical protein
VGVGVWCVCPLQEAAAEQQREFERARAVMEAQLRQLSAHMSSKEALIAALQRSEAEARLLSQQYQVGEVEWGRGGGVLQHSMCMRREYRAEVCVHPVHSMVYSVHLTC